MRMYFNETSAIKSWRAKSDEVNQQQYLAMKYNEAPSSDTSKGSGAKNSRIEVH